MNDLACIHMYYNLERNIMKRNMVVLFLGSKGKFLCIFVLCSLQCLYFCFKNFLVGNFYIGLKPTLGIKFVSASRGRLCC